MSDIKTDNSVTLANALAEITRLQSENEALETRVAELEESGDLVCDQLRQWQATERDEDSIAAIALWLSVRSLSDSPCFILRKQAEAVEKFAKDEGMSWPTTLAKGLAAAAKQYAQHLRQQADELEAGKAGGEQCL